MQLIIISEFYDIRFCDAPESSNTCIGCVAVVVLMCNKNLQLQQKIHHQKPNNLGCDYIKTTFTSIQILKKKYIKFHCLAI